MRLIPILAVAACCGAPIAPAQTGPAQTGPAQTGPAQTGPAQTGPDVPMRLAAPILRQLSQDAVADGPMKEVRIFHDTLRPGLVTPWHVHDASPMYYIISGAFTLEFKDRPEVVVHAGEGFVEPVGVVLRGRSAATGPTEFVIVQVSDPAKPFLRMVAP